MKELSIIQVASGEYVTEAVQAEYNGVMLQVDGEGVSYAELSLDGEVWSAAKQLRDEHGSQVVLIEMLAGTYYRVRGGHIKRVVSINNIINAPDSEGGGSASEIEYVPEQGLIAKNVQDAISEVAGKANTAQATASGAASSAQTANQTATNAYNIASGLSSDVAAAEAAAADASAAAVNAGAAADAVGRRVSVLEEKKTVTSETITAMELITQSDYDTKNALGELSDTTAYLITE